jgi:hypothetical protein
MKHQPQNTEITNTQPTQLCTLGYSVLPYVSTLRVNTSDFVST